MLLAINSLARPPRLAVFAYDIACERRARRVRGLLQSVHEAAQYSVFEVLVTEGAFRGLLAEATAFCDLAEDRMAVWWPRRAVRLDWKGGSLVVRGGGLQPVATEQGAAAAHGVTNFMVCYDVSGDEARAKVAAQVGIEAAMVQRSVYWLRMRADRLITLFERCGSYLADGDRLWAYPLRRSGDLWRVGAERCAVLPMAADSWPREGQ